MGPADAPILISSELPLPLFVPDFLKHPRLILLLGSSHCLPVSGNMFPKSYNRLLLNTCVSDHLPLAEVFLDHVV